MSDSDEQRRAVQALRKIQEAMLLDGIAPSADDEAIERMVMGAAEVPLPSERALTMPNFIAARDKVQAIAGARIRPGSPVVIRADGTIVAARPDAGALDGLLTGIDPAVPGGDISGVVIHTTAGDISGSASPWLGGAAASHPPHGTPIPGGWRVGDTVKLRPSAPLTSLSGRYDTLLEVDGYAPLSDRVRVKRWPGGLVTALVDSNDLIPAHPDDTSVPVGVVLPVAPAAPPRRAALAIRYADGETQRVEGTEAEIAAVRAALAAAGDATWEEAAL